MLRASRRVGLPTRATRDEPLLEAWLRQELRRTFDHALDEDLPDELLDVLREAPVRH